MFKTRSRFDQVAYSGIILLFFLTPGLFYSAFKHYFYSWQIAVFFLTAVTVVLLFLLSRRGESNISGGFRVLTIFYILTLAAVVIPHTLALARLAPSFRVNVQGHPARVWSRENVKFAIFYLLFPILCLLHQRCLRRTNLRQVVGILGSICLLNAMIIILQICVPGCPLNLPFWQMQRFGGLATDPNASAMTAFLCLPVFAAALLITKRSSWKYFHLGVICALIWIIAMGGNRTVAGGVALLIVLAPLTLAIANRQWSIRRRIIFGLLPIATLIVVLVMAPILSERAAAGEIGVLGKRLALTWQKFATGGVERVFNEGEARGKLFEAAWSLVQRSPLSGWGPGGFYREYSNEVFFRSGRLERSFDSALNHYLMIAGDFGLPVLAVNLVLLLLPVAAAVRALSLMRERSERIAVSWLLTANIIFLFMICTLPPSYFPETLWVWTAELVYLARAGKGRMDVQSRWVFALRQLRIPVAIALLLFVIVGSYQTSFGSLGYKVRGKVPWWCASREYECLHNAFLVR